MNAYARGHPMEAALLPSRHGRSDPRPHRRRSRARARRDQGALGPRDRSRGRRRGRRRRRGDRARWKAPAGRRRDRYREARDQRRGGDRTDQGRAPRGRGARADGPGRRAVRLRDPGSRCRRLPAEGHPRVTVGRGGAIRARGRGRAAPGDREEDPRPVPTIRRERGRGPVADGPRAGRPAARGTRQEQQGDRARARPQRTNGAGSPRSHLQEAPGRLPYGGGDPRATPGLVPAGGPLVNGSTRIAPVRGLRRFGTPPPWARPLRRRLHEPAFWAIQAAVLSITGLHLAVEALDLFADRPAVASGLHHVPVILYLIPIVFAGLRYGFEGAVLTSGWALVLTLPNIFVWHSGSFMWASELLYVSVVVGIGVAVAAPVERERRQRERLVATSRRLALLNDVASALVSSVALERTLPAVLERLRDVLVLEAAGFARWEPAATTRGWLPRSDGGRTWWVRCWWYRSRTGRSGRGTKSCWPPWPARSAWRSTTSGCTARRKSYSARTSTRLRGCRRRSGSTWHGSCTTRPRRISSSSAEASTLLPRQLS